MHLSIEKNGLRNAALLGRRGQVKENTIHGSALEIKPDIGHMSRRQPERCLHGETKDGATASARSRGCNGGCNEQ